MLPVILSGVRIFTSPYPRGGRRDSYRDGRGATAAHPRSLFLH